MKKKKSNTPLVIIIFLLSIGLIILLLKLFVAPQSHFSSDFGTIQATLDQALIQPVQTSECSMTITPRDICAGDMVTGVIRTNPSTLCYVFVHDGIEWRQIFNGRTDLEGRFSHTDRITNIGHFRFIAICDIDHSDSFTPGDCITNTQDLNVRDCGPVPDPTPPPYNVGDSVGGGSGSGSTSGSESVTFDLSSIPVGGDCYLGAKIYIEWDYEDESKCYTMNDQQGVSWAFTDSSSIAWESHDPHPQTHIVDLCPLHWSGNHNWGLFMDPYFEMPDCKINYNYNVDIYVCECN